MALHRVDYVEVLPRSAVDPDHGKVLQRFAETEHGFQNFLQLILVQPSARCHVPKGLLHEDVLGLHE